MYRCNVRLNELQFYLILYIKNLSLSHAEIFIKKDLYRGALINYKKCICYDMIVNLTYAVDLLFNFVSFLVMNVNQNRLLMQM